MLSSDSPHPVEKQAGDVFSCGNTEKKAETVGDLSSRSSEGAVTTGAVHGMHNLYFSEGLLFMKPSANERIILSQLPRIVFLTRVHQILVSSPPLEAMSKRWRSCLVFFCCRRKFRTVYVYSAKIS